MATTCATGSHRTNITNGTTQVFTGRTVVMHLVVTNATTGDSISVYDDTSGTANPVLEWVATDGKGRFEAFVPIRNGIRVVATITTTRAYLVWGV
jgi:hypothetical protein